jgi:hypothetical protein
MAPRTPIKISAEAEPEADAGIPPEPPMSFVHRPIPVNALLLGQQLADALLAARTLINRTPTDLAVMVEELRRWYYTLHPDERERLLWQRFTEAKQRHARLQHAIEVVREALALERPLLVQAQAEHEALATRPLPATIEEEASGIRADAVRRYQSAGIECQQRAAAIAELERLLPAPEQALGPLTEAVTRVLEAVETVYREAVAHRVSESGELEHFRSRFERLRAEANAHAAEIEEWSQRVGRPLRIPQIAFSWPPDPVWQALLDSAVEGPKLIWDDDPNASSS